jgi:hypothetical protein
MTATQGTLFSNRALGWAFVLIAVTLTLLMAYVIVQIVQPLTSPTTFSTKVVEAYTRDLGADGQGKKIDEDTVRFLVGLEYSAAAIRTVGVQVAFAIVGGFFLIVVGILLFASGSIQPFAAEVTGSRQSLTLRDAAPGTVAALLGAIILGLGITKGMGHGEISFSRKTPVAGNPTNAASFHGGMAISNDPVPDDPRYQRGQDDKAEPNKP